MSVHGPSGIVSPARLRLGQEPEITLRGQIKYHALPIIAGVAFLTIIPWIHIGYVSDWYLPYPKPKIDTKHCRCDCFDTVFRGAYEYPPSTYKPVYFNAVPATLKLLILCLTYTILSYEIIRYILHNIMTSQLRTRMVMGVLTFVYPVYYSWWSFFNYINERFHNYWWHDGFFALTEVISLLMFVHFTNINSNINATKLLIPLAINLVHILVGGLDQFIENLFFGAGEKFHQARNIALVVPDFIIVCFCIIEIRALSLRNKVSFSKLFYKEEVALALVFILISTILLGTLVSQ